VCLLTGAGGTLGSAFCRLYSDSYDIVAVYRTRRPTAVSQHESFVDPFAPTADLPENEDRIFAVRADLEEAADVDRVVDVALARFGRVDLLVNNAGLMDPEEVPVWEADPDEWWSVVESHIRGVLLPVHAVVPGMVARQHGRVVSLASGLSTRGGRLYSAYSVGKTGLMRLTETLAAGLEGTGVHAFDVSPGVVRTAMSTSMSIHEGRTEWTDPADVVALVAAIAAGELDQWSGRMLNTRYDDLDTLRHTRPEGVGRQLRMIPYGDTDPVPGP
jgi:NAD(P)-dependent dehydrogenase (short-subunit alcohol dehydrogenase family)